MTTGSSYREARETEGSRNQDLTVGFVQISFAFCPSYHRDLRHRRGNSKEMEDLLQFYFQKGFSYKNILLLLSKYHDTKMCMRTVQ